MIFYVFKTIMEELPLIKDRIKGKSYVYNGVIRIWDGKKLKCEHSKNKSQCKDCGGSSICEHYKQRSHCKKCGGSSICDHNRFRPFCKECGGASICEHIRIRSRCKECKGAQICEHKRRRYDCKYCRQERKCKTSFCDTIITSNKYQGYCFACFVLF